jgi:glucarate dehydratase
VAVKIVDLTSTVVTVPMRAPLRWSMGVETGTTRALIELVTDEGIVGIGETYGSHDTQRALDAAKPFVVGLDPFETGALHHRLGVFRIGYETTVPATLRAGIEMACCDAAGKALGRPVYSLLGGKVRDTVEVAAYLFYRHPTADGSEGGESTPEAIVERTEALVEAHGFRAIKLKGGVFAPEEELAAVVALQERFPTAPLRWDPNAAWSLSTSLRVVDRLRAEGIVLEYLEDPTPELEGMAQVRNRTTVPLATNMCLVTFEQLAPGIRLGSVDVILSDVHFWGGFRANLRMMAVCEAFGLGVGMHSDRELGVSTAAMLHLAAASPLLSYAIDSHYPDQAGDVISEPFVFSRGELAVPDGPGLGVELDPDQVERYRREFERTGAVNEFYDPGRPDWVPALPLF